MGTNAHSSLTEDQKKSLSKARLQISKQVDTKGNYSHNIVSIILREVSHTCGYEAADALVDELELTKVFDIPKSGRSGAAKSLRGNPS